MIPLFFLLASLLATVSRFGVPGVADMAQAHCWTLFFVGRRQDCCASLPVTPLSNWRQT
jgi:hypothetical protein